MKTFKDKKVYPFGETSLGGDDLTNWTTPNPLPSDGEVIAISHFSKKVHEQWKKENGYQ